MTEIKIDIPIATALEDSQELLKRFTAGAELENAEISINDCEEHADMKTVTITTDTAPEHIPIQLRAGEVLTRKQ